MAKTLPDHARARIRQLAKRIETLGRQCDEKVRTSLAKYRRVIETTSEGFLELDVNFRITDYNSTVLALAGVSAEQLLHSSFEKLYDKQTVYVHFASADHLSFEAAFHSRSGESVPVLFKRSILRDENGLLDGYLVFLTELTELKNIQENLRRVETKYRDIYQNAVQGMYQCTLAGRLLGINPAFARIFGYEETTQLVNEVVDITTLYKDKNDRQNLLAALNTDRFITNYEVEMIDRGGKSLWALINARLATDTDGNTLVEGILINNTEKRLAEERLHRSRERFRYLANHDSLTGLFNTRYLYRALEKLIDDSNSTGKPFSLVFLDMDNFKQVVDTYGHLNGSQALKEVAETLRQCLLEPAFGVAYGGDEFVLVLPQTAKHAALEQVQQIRDLMKATEYLTKKQLQVHMSASFGVATYPDDAVEAEELLALADQAMFRIKARGKDAVGVPVETEAASANMPDQARLPGVE